MPQSPEKMDTRREEILEAAWAVFAEKGFGGATMHEIASRAHASKGTLYTWFGDKTQLFETLLKSRLRSVGATLAAEAGPAFEPERVLYIVARDLLRFLNSPGNMALYRAAQSEARHFPALKEMLVRSIDRTEFAGYFEMCRARGLMQFDDAKEIAAMFMAMAQGEWPLRLSYGIIERMSEDEIDAQAKLATRMFLKAVEPVR